MEIAESDPPVSTRSSAPVQHAPSEAVRLLVFAASTRTASLNRDLADRAAEVAARLGARVRVVELADYPMPLYDGDLERDRGVPAGAGDLATLIRDHDALLIATPEYNGAFSPLLKNTIDWVSRVERRLLADKAIGLLSATPGPGGGLRGLALTRNWLTNMRARVVDESFSLPQAKAAYGPDGELLSPHAERLEEFVGGVVAAVDHRAVAA